MPSDQSPIVSMALSRLRAAVAWCCGIIAVCLLVQTFIWCMAAFTNVRHTLLEAPPAAAPVIVKHENSPAVTRSIARTSSSGSAAEHPPVEPVNPNRVLSKSDRVMSHASALARALGSVATLMVLPLLAVVVVICIGSRTLGTHDSVAAFIWSLPLALLILPLGSLAGLPWQEGALHQYATMATQVDQQQAGSEGAWGAVTYYGRFALLPLVCAAGLGLVWMRFAAGVSAGIIPKEDLRLDPVLEREAANVKPGSLFGGRTGNAMRAVGLASPPERQAVPIAAGADASEDEPPLPRRLI